MTKEKIMEVLLDAKTLYHKNCETEAALVSCGLWFSVRTKRKSVTEHISILDFLKDIDPTKWSLEKPEPPKAKPKSVTLYRFTLEDVNSDKVHQTTWTNKSEFLTTEYIGKFRLLKTESKTVELD